MVARTGRGGGSAEACALGADERPNLGYRAGVQDVPRLDPAPTGSAHTEPHLPIECACAMAVTVDRDRHPSRDSRVGACTVQVEMAWGAVDLEGCSGFGRGSIDRLEV